MHESLERLEQLANTYVRVCIGSSGEFATVGTEAWWVKMGQAMRAICDDMGYESAGSIAAAPAAPAPAAEEAAKPKAPAWAKKG